MSSASSSSAVVLNNKSHDAKKRESYCEKSSETTASAVAQVQVRTKAKTKRPKSTFAPFFNHSSSHGFNLNSFPQPINTSSYILPNSGPIAASPHSTTSHNQHTAAMKNNPFYKYISNKNEASTQHHPHILQQQQQRDNEFMSQSGFALNRLPHTSSHTISNFYHPQQLPDKQTSTQLGGLNNTFTSSQQLFAKKSLKPSTNSSEANCNSSSADPSSIFNSNSSFYRNRIFNRHR
jgi:hypothetical protein